MRLLMESGWILDTIIHGMDLSPAMAMQLCSLQRE